MIDKRFTQVGLDRIVRLVWLERVSSLVLAGNEAEDIKAILQQDLKGAFRSSRTDVRGSIDKTITILTKVWVKVPSGLDSLRDGGLELLQHLPRRDRLAVHWGMTMAAYPFWAAVAAQTGRLLRLQGSAGAAHVQRRVREQYGERETVARRVRYVLRSYLDWGVLQETDATGVYGACPPIAVEGIRLTGWLVEALLYSRANGSSPLRELLESPSLFPFQVVPVSAEGLVSASNHLDLLRQGLDDALVMLAEPKQNR